MTRREVEDNGLLCYWSIEPWFPMAFEGCYELQGFNDLMELSTAVKSEKS